MISSNSSDTFLWNVLKICDTYVWAIFCTTPTNYKNQNSFNDTDVDRDDFGIKPTINMSYSFMENLAFGFRWPLHLRILLIIKGTIWFRNQNLVSKQTCSLAKNEGVVHYPKKAPFSIAMLPVFFDNCKIAILSWFFLKLKPIPNA